MRLFAFAGCLTSAGVIWISPAETTGTPEIGDIRAVFVEDEQEVGLFSNNADLRHS
jgi:hypothetical protein